MPLRDEAEEQLRDAHQRISEGASGMDKDRIAERVAETAQLVAESRGRNG